MAAAPAEDGSADGLAAEHAALHEVRERVMNVVGHALRTPMATVRGQVEVLARTADEAQREQLVGGLLRTTRQLERLLDDVLVAAGIETRLPVRPPQDVRVTDVVQVVWAEQGSDRPLEVTGDPVATARVGPDALRWMLGHLIDNAVRYGHGPVEVGIRVLGDRTTVTVGGDGPDLAPGELANAFELFYRGHHAVMVAGARMGVGLPVARRLAEHMGGTVTLESRRGGGTVAVATLPSS
ncbi:MAG: HAMP domain-containing histidine kinase [Actinobacteria bacterium]|nr:HAMP domain-containing histidine kinase [Actinomycetota bacterium]